MRRLLTYRLGAIAAGACALLVPATAQATSTKAEIEASVSKGVSYLESLQTSSGGFESDWDLGALAAGKIAAANVKKAGASTDARTWYRKLVGNETATKWPAKAIATEYERAALNAYAAGIEPARVSQTQNLIAGILSFSISLNTLATTANQQCSRAQSSGCSRLRMRRRRKAFSACRRRCWKSRSR
jgi:hypothetical protein